MFKDDQQFKSKQRHDIFDYESKEKAISEVTKAIENSYLSGYTIRVEVLQPQTVEVEIPFIPASGCLSQEDLDYG